MEDILSTKLGPSKCYLKLCNYCLVKMKVFKDKDLTYWGPIVCCGSWYKQLLELQARKKSRRIARDWLNWP